MYLDKRKYFGVRKNPGKYPGFLRALYLVIKEVLNARGSCLGGAMQLYHLDCSGPTLEEGQGGSHPIPPLFQNLLNKSA